MSFADLPADAFASLQQTLDGMPPVAAMQVKLLDFTDGRLRVHAPLAANINDKGNAFGGSLASAMTLAGWALVNLQLRRAGLDADVYVADSTLRYRSPVYVDLVATAQTAEAAEWGPFIKTFAQRGRARVSLVASVDDGAGGAAAEFSGRYAALARQ